MSTRPPRNTARSPDLDVAIVGSGFAGLGMAIRLKQERRRSFAIFEQADAIGGTWRDNHYPGCACDVPSHLYSFSFEPNPRWSRMFAPSTEIRAYLEHCVDRYRLRPHIRLGAEVVRAIFDEARGMWRVQLRGGAEVTARYLVFGTGPLSRPAYPAVAGLDRFRGAQFHSARWDHQVDLAGKRIAVIGTGASAIQFVPRIAPGAGRLHLFQRTAPWVLPKPDRAISDRERRLFAALPATQRAYRWWIYWRLESRTLAFTVEPRIMRLARRVGLRHLEAQVADPELRRRLTPDYLPGCKRILMADDYYPALARPNVEVVTDAIDRVTETGVVTADGRERPVDAIIHGTGFRVTDVLSPLEIIGRGGVDLNELWRERMSAYLGTTIAGFPNFFMLLGPNTGLGHNSIVFMIEAQVDYALACMRAAERRGARSLEVLERAQIDFNEALQPRLARSIWASGCKSWYLDARGNNSAAWPGFTADFWRRTRRVVARHYAFDREPVTPAVGRPAIRRLRALAARRR